MRTDWACRSTVIPTANIISSTNLEDEMPGLWVCEPLEEFQKTARAIYYVAKTLQIIDSVL